MKTNILIVAGFTIFLSQAVFAEWTVSETPLGPGYNVSDGEQTIHVNTEKTAKKMAKALNKHEGKQSGVKDDGDCPDIPGVLC